ncbi:hypothetical protein V1498_01545 [Peribacillus sp. SCS-26]|uniref:hypothetical protein n=1 Tax=Paraperibacillus marinus TaxID=3115295 RepID=UPI0039059AD6
MCWIDETLQEHRGEEAYRQHRGKRSAWIGITSLDYLPTIKQRISTKIERLFVDYLIIIAIFCV